MTVIGDDASVQVDTYLDALLASRARVLAATDDATAELAHAAAVVRDALVRFHPSFHFEEDLAGRLRAVAAGTARAATLVRFPTPAATLATAGAGAASAGDLAAGPILDDDTVVPAGAERAWMLVGGAIASGVSLAAGVLLARRRSRDHRWERLT